MISDFQGPNKIVVFHGWIVDGIKINGQLNGGNGGNKARHITITVRIPDKEL